MGYFTWTDCAYPPVKKKNDEYAHKVGYIKYVRVICPDDSIIEEQCYEGYGRFNGKDIFELLVDWNKPYLEEIFSKIKISDFGYELRNVAIAYQKDDYNLLTKEFEVVKKSKANHLAKEWKRTIGIAIEDLCPFCIKVTNKKKHAKYNDLFKSVGCQ